MAQLKQTTISSDSLALKVQNASTTEVFKVETTGQNGSTVKSSAESNIFAHDITLESNLLKGNGNQKIELGSNDLFYTIGNTKYKVLLGTISGEAPSGVNFAKSGALGGSAISAKKLVSGDTIDSSVYTVGDNTHLIYFSGGIPVISTGNVGNSTKPMYLENGELKATTYQLNATFNGLAGSGSATTASKSDHTHSTTLATDSGTSSISLGFGSKYKLTAGGNSVIFTTPSLGNTATTAAAGNHTHNLSLATDNGTSSITLAYNAKYKLTAGGNSIIFTTVPKQTVNTTNLTVYYSDGTSGTLTVATGIN